MKIEKLLSKIKKQSNCELIINQNPNRTQTIKLPEDLEYFYANYDGIKLFIDKPYGIEIVSLEELVVTNDYLYPKGDVIWEELEGDISENWFMIAKSESLSQYISIDLNEEYKGLCYDSFIETHANPDDCPIIAKSFTELLENLLNSKGEYWYWQKEDFKTYGDAYENRLLNG